MNFENNYNLFNEACKLIELLIFDDFSISFDTFIEFYGSKDEKPTFLPGNINYTLEEWKLIHDTVYSLKYGDEIFFEEIEGLTKIINNIKYKQYIILNKLSK